MGGTLRVASVPVRGTPMKEVNEEVNALFE